MGKFDIKSLFLFIITALLSSCSKNEDLADIVISKSAMLEYAVPLGSVSFNETSLIKLGLTPLKVPKSPVKPLIGTTRIFNLIPVPSAKYIKETHLLDISKLTPGSFYHQIGTQDFYLSLFSRFDEKLSFQKLKGTASTYGWNCKWNRLPFVEKEHPDVLFNPDSRGEFLIVLSKPCTAFGFELAPNIKDKNTNFIGFYGNGNWDYSSGKISALTTFSPSGARLFAIKSARPFTTVTLHWAEYANAENYTPGGSAIANIRYKLAE
ncbi:hypothetical protein [Arcticibacter eurypsychrophilus]|uniref:hypothetical protein n=1 Tax=Arcticibacter eurypsychrophilus TaxID=1434752 RepID=UPI00084D0DD8|nr:hypothetical protein [Arcticibacter eurypsychrophilus]